MVKKYVPEKGDLVWITLDPTEGHEQVGHGPALVISHYDYNKNTGLMVCFPITSKVKGFYSELEVNEGHIKGVVLPVHIRSLDYTVPERKVTFIKKASPQLVDDAICMFLLIIDVLK